MKLSLLTKIFLFCVWLILLYVTHVTYYKKTMYAIAAAPVVMAFVYGLYLHKKDTERFDDFARTQNRLYAEQLAQRDQFGATNPPF